MHKNTLLIGLHGSRLREVVISSSSRHRICEMISVQWSVKGQKNFLFGTKIISPNTLYLLITTCLITHKNLFSTVVSRCKSIFFFFSLQIDYLCPKSRLFTKTKIDLAPSPIFLLVQCGRRKRNLCQERCSVSPL